MGKAKIAINPQRLLWCLEKLSTLHGSLVIIGSSLAENDKHIFNQVNKSAIDTIYLGSCEEEKNKDKEKANTMFPDKKAILFNYKSISYSTPNPLKTAV